MGTIQNNYSRRDFIKTTAAAVAAVGAGGLLSTSGCGKDLTFAIPASVMNGIGSMSYSSTMSDYNAKQSVVKTGKHADWVQKTGDEIKLATEQYMKEQGTTSKFNRADMQYHLIDDPTVNAWCMPGARIAFYDGIMPLCDNIEGVAAVMGHEVAHAVYNHSGQRMAQQLALQLGITSLSVALSKINDNDPLVSNIALTVFSMGGQAGLLAYSRKHEYEADKMGLILMARAGFNPTEAPKFWDRMTARFGKGGSDFFSTHPSNEKRAKELNNAMEEAMSHYRS